jgi:hypothetical protein
MRVLPLPFMKRHLLAQISLQGLFISPHLRMQMNGFSMDGTPVHLTELLRFSYRTA